MTCIKLSGTFPSSLSSGCVDSIWRNSHGADSHDWLYTYKTKVFYSTHQCSNIYETLSVVSTGNVSTLLFPRFPLYDGFREGRVTLSAGLSRWTTFTYCCRPTFLGFLQVPLICHYSEFRTGHLRSTTPCNFSKRAASSTWNRFQKELNDKFRDRKRRVLCSHTYISTRLIHLPYASLPVF